MIKCRAKETIEHEWICSNGYYFDGINYWFTIPTKNPAIAWAKRLIVDPETISMGVEIVDNNGIEIYTGDLVHSWGGECCQGIWEYDVMIEVKMCGACLLELENSENLEIIGNKWDNEELGPK